MRTHFTLILALVLSSFRLFAQGPECFDALHKVGLNEIEALQLKVQRGKGFTYPKEIGRGLKEYNYEFFYGADSVGELATKFKIDRPHEYLAHYISKELGPQQPASIPSLLAAIRKKNNRPAHWADISSGLALPMREIKAENPIPQQDIKLTAVDIVDWEKKLDWSLPFDPKSIEGKTDGEVNQKLVEHEAALTVHFVKKKMSSPNAFHKNRPEFIHAEASTFQLSEQADLITMVHSAMYYPDRVGALTNAYNQLKDGGMLIVQAHDLAQLTAWDNPDVTVNRKDSPWNVFVSELKENGIEVYEHSATLLIVKKANSKIELRVPPRKTELTKYGFVRTFYPDTKSLGLSLLKVSPN